MLQGGYILKNIIVYTGLGSVEGVIHHSFWNVSRLNQ